MTTHAVYIPQDIQSCFYLPEYVREDDFREMFPEVSVAPTGNLLNLDGESVEELRGDWSAFADVFAAYTDHRTVVRVSDNRLAMVLAGRDDRRHAVRQIALAKGATV